MSALLIYAFAIAPFLIVWGAIKVVNSVLEPRRTGSDAIWEYVRSYRLLQVLMTGVAFWAVFLTAGMVWQTESAGDVVRTAVIAPLLLVPSLWGAYAFNGRRVRWNDAGIEDRSWLRRARWTQWEQISAAGISPYGTHLWWDSTEGRTKLSLVCRPSYKLIEALKKHLVANFKGNAQIEAFCREVGRP